MKEDLTIAISEHRGVRKLHFGSDSVQGAMRISHPWRLELEYTHDLLACLLFHDCVNGPKRVLCIGLGVGAVPKFIYKYFPQTTVEVVELHPQVVAVCQSQFGLPDLGNRFQVHVDCGARFLRKTQHRYDLIVLDGFDEKGNAGPLETLGFFQIAHSKLLSGGVLSANLLSHIQGTDLVLNRLKIAFPEGAFRLAPCESGNAIALGLCAAAALPHQFDLHERQAQLERITGESWGQVTKKVMSLGIGY